MSEVGKESLVPHAVGEDGEPEQDEGASAGKSKMGKDDIKCVVIGDAAVGKTCMLISYTTNTFPSEYTPTVFDNYKTKIDIDGQVRTLHLWDTAGSEHFDLLRPLSYNDANVFIICYAINHKESYENIKIKWVRDLRAEAPKTPFILAATKVDLRDLKNKENMVTASQGQNMAKDVGAAFFVETSSITQEGLRDCFNEAITLAMIPREAETLKGGICCTMM